MDRLTPSSLEGSRTLVLWLRTASARAFKETFVCQLVTELKETAEEPQSRWS